MQVYTCLNHLNVTMSYNATLELVTEASRLHQLPLQQWIAERVQFKFVGDNLDKKKGVRDIRADRQSEMQHMYSLLVVQSRMVLPENTSDAVRDISLLTPSAFLPAQQDIDAIQENLVILVACVLCNNMKFLSSFSEYVTKHIANKYATEMGKKSEVIVLDVMMKQETKSAHMLDIMWAMQGYLGESYPQNKTVLCGGDHVTCERQVNAKRHLRDGDTSFDRLDVFEPQPEDFHALMSYLGVSESTYIQKRVVKDKFNTN